MTTPAGRRARGKRLRSWPRWCAALVAAAASLAAFCLPGTARADTTTGYDQMTGVGSTASAITVPWTQGLLDNTNTPLTNDTTDLASNADRGSANPTGKLSFMYNDFKTLKVTVSQTQNLGHQGVTVSWTGGQPTVGTGPVQENYLQMMECWGDATTGPTPEQCEYGSAGLLQSGAPNTRIGTREGDLCPAGAVASTTAPPSSKSGEGPPDGCDPQEPGGDPTHQAPCPGPYCAADLFKIPFSPVSDPSTTGLDYAGSSDTTYYSEANTDEVQMAVTAADKTGQQQFETLTGIQASGLGCGQAEADNSPRGCWLVIVPRGTYEPNGYQINPNNGNSFISTSPLSASNWAQRIQIHLGFAPTGAFCQPGTLERQTFGTQLVARAMQSWQLSLNQAAKCSKVYGYSAVPEATSTLNLEAGGDSGLAFTTIPIGSEATRNGLSAPANLPTILYAPVAIAALDFGFNINIGASGFASTPVKLTPLLLAKALTQSYRQDLPDFFQGSGGPAWSQGNPLNISEDPAFQTLNGSAIPGWPTGPIAPLLTEDHSALNQQTWQWILGSPAATAWLGGTADASDGGMKVDTDYQALKLGQAAIDSFPRAYSGVLSVCEPVDASPSPSPSPSASPACPAGQRLESKHSLDLLPYTDNYDSASATILAASNADAGEWDAQATAPDGTLGWWDKTGVESLGQIFMWAADATPDLAAYGLVPAQLCNEGGTSCVSPSVSAVTTAVSAAKSVNGLLQVDPANPGTNGYPLTQIIYAAVPTNQSAAALSDYASLIAYAAGSGQTAGTAPGDLPPGYLPLPSNLQTQAQAVATQLQTLATASPSPSTSSSGSSSSAASSSSSAASSSAGQSPATQATTGSGTTAGGSSSTAAGAGAAAGGATPTPGTAPMSAPAAIPASSPAPTPAAALGKVPVSGSTPTQGAVISFPPATAAASKTPPQAVGPIRWALIVVAIAGAAFAGGGAYLRSDGMPPWLRRRKLE
jgi:hypothetical protein